MPSTPSAEAVRPPETAAPDPRGTGFALDRYYEAQGLNPSYRSLDSEAALAAHAQERRRLFQDRLGLPPLAIRGARVADVGADTGENALVFAQWGARVSVFEPRQDAHPIITDYFTRFDLRARLDWLGAERLEAIAGEPFDIVNAEGFIGSIQPMARWLRDMNRLVAPEGLFHVSYFARAGAFVETMIRALVVGVAARRDQSVPEVARSLMMAKWDGVGSARRFEAWVGDHLVNPVARRAYLVDGADLVREAAAHGFRLQASTPAYHDPLWIGWYKARRAVDDEIRGIEDHLTRASLGQAAGASLYYGGHVSGAAEIAALVDATMGAADDCCDRPDGSRFKALAASLRALHGTARNCSMWVGRLDETGVSALLTGLAGAFEDLGAGTIEAVERYCAEDKAFLERWGTPVHFALFRRDSDAAPESGS